MKIDFCCGYYFVKKKGDGCVGVILFLKPHDS